MSVMKHSAYQYHSANVCMLVEIECTGSYWIDKQYTRACSLHAITDTTSRAAAAITNNDASLNEVLERVFNPDPTAII